MFPHDVAYILTFHLYRHEDTIFSLRKSRYEKMVISMMFINFPEEKFAESRSSSRSLIFTPGLQISGAPVFKMPSQIRQWLLWNSI